MKHFSLFVMVATFAAHWHSPVQADVSEDLKFCSGLKSSKERLACYDASMRPGRSAPVLLAATVAPRLTVTPLPPEPKTSRFGGIYAGVSGGYEFQVSKPYIASQIFPGPAVAPPILSPVVPLDSLKGAKVGGVFGYNAEAEQLLLGFEARAQYSFSKSNQSLTVNSNSGVTFPYTASFLSCSGCTQDFLNNYPTNVGPLGLNSSLSQSLARSHQWQVDFSARSGITFGDTLVYAKAGVGAEDSLYTTGTAFTSAVCDPSVVRQRPDPSSVAIVVTGCNSISNATLIGGSSERGITPIAILGGGLERNFGNYFLRAEGEFTAHFINGGGIYYSPSANVVGGYRFPPSLPARADEAIE